MNDLKALVSLRTASYGVQRAPAARRADPGKHKPAANTCSARRYQRRPAGLQLVRLRAGRLSISVHHRIPCGCIRARLHRTRPARNRESSAAICPGRASLWAPLLGTQSPADDSIWLLCACVRATARPGRWLAGVMTTMQCNWHTRLVAGAHKIHRRRQPVNEWLRWLRPVRCWSRWAPLRKRRSD